MDIYCTVCSKEKKKDSQLLPAIERYVGKHVQQIYGWSIDAEVDFRILSGKYGLLKAEEHIPYYDKRHAENDVLELRGEIERQLQEQKIKKITFFTETGDGWKPYRSSIEQACNELAIEFIVKEI